jgi:hypothetical protein
MELDSPPVLADRPSALLKVCPPLLVLALLHRAASARSSMGGSTGTGGSHQKEN